jgi:hypothetical protein
VPSSRPEASARQEARVGIDLIRVNQVEGLAIAPSKLEGGQRALALSAPFVALLLLGGGGLCTPIVAAGTAAAVVCCFSVLRSEPPEAAAFLPLRVARPSRPQAFGGSPQRPGHCARVFLGLRGQPPAPGGRN